MSSSSLLVQGADPEQHDDSHEAHRISWFRATACLIKTDLFRMAFLKELLIITFWIMVFVFPETIFVLLFTHENLPAIDYSTMEETFEEQIPVSFYYN